MRYRWIGRSILFVAALHLVAAPFLYSDQYREMASAGVIASADDYSARAAAYWFTAFAPVLAIVGLLIDAIELRGEGVPVTVPLIMLAAVSAMVLVMPVSGVWLLFPPTLGLLFRSRQLALPKDDRTRG